MYIFTAINIFFTVLFNRRKAKLWQKLEMREYLLKEKQKGTLTEKPSSPSNKKSEDISLEKELDAAYKDMAQEPKAENNEGTSGYGDAVYTLVLFQREGRLIDFLMEDINDYEDAQIGAAVRQIHSGSRKVLEENFSLQPVCSQPEGEDLTLEEGFNPEEYNLSGNIKGSAPFTGSLRHKGWKAKKIDLPKRHKSKDPAIICPAEVEI